MHPPSSFLHARQTHAPRGLYFLCLLGLLSFLGLPAAAQTRPLRTTEAEVLPPGTLRAQVGFDFLQEVDFPLSGLTGDLTSVGVINVRLGVGKMVEVQLEGAVQNFLDAKRKSGGFVPLELDGACTTPSGAGQLSGCSTNDTGDFSLATKVRIWRESDRRPALAMRFGFKMPNSKQNRGIGTNSTDVFAAFILQKHFGRLDIFGNVGLAILQASNTKFSQNDVIIYGGAFAFPLHPRLKVVGEVAGRQSTRKINADLTGTESRSQARFGLQIFTGGFQWDLAGIAGLTKTDARSGFTFGISKDIHLFDYGKVQ